jgi:hypothetical protein
MMAPLILAFCRPNGGPVMAAYLSSGQLGFQPDMPVWSIAVATMRDAAAFFLAATSHAPPPNGEARILEELRIPPEFPAPQPPGSTFQPGQGARLR